MTKAQFLSTEAVPHAQRREWLCEVIGREYARADAYALPTQPLFNETTIYGERDVRISAIRSNAILIERPKRPSLPDSHDVYLAVVLLSGEYFLEQGERRAALRPGDMTIYDATRPHKIYCPGSFSKLIVSLPRTAMRTRLPNIDRRLAAPIAGARGLGAIAAAHIRSIAAHAAEIADESFAAATDHCADLIALSVADSQQIPATARGRDATLRRVKRFIESRLGDPRLDPAMAAQALGLSSRYLNALFEAEGLSLMRYVWARRLENCRRDLCADVCAPIGEIAYRWGFSDLSHFSRAFRRRFGQSARAARAGSK
ncbi:helix-turn-helix domain-containing protein [Methylocystis sp.]|uniref:helix-turn-helix domain-containing protein n=1 Tax=Methylocystis sp. TaxID=1911079 RepID=UPI002733F817|nr:helix-turn-helix domain-containing protein [Methylocystis sp.]MDP3552557.1 helix-turn-helix domain-containing protein [Methylocystis sp.]